MNNAQFEKKIENLLNDASEIPSPQREKLFLLARKSRENHKKLQEKLNGLQQSMDYLRLAVKYLIFDLEATRRENTDLRKQLNDSQRD